MRLRPVVDQDLPTLFEHQRDPEAAKMAHFAPRERDDFFVHWRTRVLAEPTSIAQTIEVEGDVAGYVVSWLCPDGSREVGYWLGHAFWGHGLASAALSEFLAHVELRRPLVAYVAVHNVASRRVLEKCGFAPSGPPSLEPDGVAGQAMLLAPDEA